MGTHRSFIRFRSTAVRVSGETGPSSLWYIEIYCLIPFNPILLVVLKKIIIYLQSRLLPLNIEVETVSDGEVSVINDKNVADVNLYVYQVWLKWEHFKMLSLLPATDFSFLRKIHAGVVVGETDVALYWRVTGYRLEDKWE